MKSTEELSRIAVAVTRRKIYELQVMDIEDMQQEAHIAIFNNQDRGEAYALSCGINAAIMWYKNFVLEWHRNDQPYLNTPQGEAVSLPERFEEEALESKRNDNIVPLSDEVIKVLTEVFISARKRGGNRTQKAVVRDLKIVALLFEGYNNHGIGQELSISADCVKQYRYKIQSILKEYHENL